MADSLRTDAVRAIDHASHADRDAKIEQLLLAGLDHYFCDRYEQAIDVWTRTLFFDRSHARARAYIERARSALAERERQSEELLQKGAAALDCGQSDEARRLLQAAVEVGAHAHDVHPLLERLSRLTRNAPASVAAPLRRVPPRAAIGHITFDAHDDRRGGVSWGRAGVWPIALLVVVVIAVAGTMAWSNGFERRSDDGHDAPAASLIARERPLPIIRRGEMALDRARSLASRGRLHEALAALATVRSTDVENADADRVRSDIQRQLLTLAGRQP